jgi:hypothetical protein
LVAERCHGPEERKGRGGQKDLVTGMNAITREPSEDPVLTEANRL